MKKFIEDNKYLIIPFIFSFLLGIVLCLFKIKSIPLVLFSLCANIFIIGIIRMILKKLKYNKKEKIIIITSVILLYLFYFISILGRKFIYYWDYSCYYNIQTSLEDAFNTSLINGIKSFISSCWSGEYGSFLCFIPEVVYNFTTKSISSYALSCVVVFIPYLVITFSILLKKLLEILKIKNNTKIFLLGILVFLSFPILHAMFIYGQPDILGLIFVFLIITLTIDYDFYKVDYERLIEIGILTYFLLITRRWYMYFILTYFLLYGVTVILTNIKNKEKIKKILKHAITYMIIVGLIFGITLFPLFRNILVNGYDYDFYYVGGFKGEIISQIKHLGYFELSIIIVGMIYGIIKEKYRKYSIILLIQYFLIIFLFTRIQNMGLHHSLLFVHIYTYFIYMFVLLILKKKILLLITTILIITNFGFGIYNTESKIFTDVPLKTPEQKDYNEILKVSSWLQKKLNNENAYMITHNNKYNPDKFRNIYLPDKTIMNHMPYGSSIIGVHKFPTELFTSKYIITTEPFEPTSVDEKYNKVFLELVKKEKFSKIKEFDMKNGYKILIYERVKDVDKEEIEMYKNCLEEESKKYPKLYIDIIEQYEKDMNF